ncbi:hypothetical protein [uncultured Stenotrophomonas sp.]|uniref:hypothetical protein n=1 Tax=uncultured Stenotrophomonas sp. TaxID=165438 RepID=UPI0025D03CE9|nr:hypothetical protein [uncultured Stenotrophomonas sp.]
MKQLQHSRPMILGVLAGALAPAIMAAIILSLSSEQGSIPIFPAALIAFLISITASTFIGLPLALWLQSQGRLTPFLLCIIGVAIGAITMAAFNFHANYWPQMHDQSLARWIAWNSAMKGALWGAIFGAISSLAFCFGAGVKPKVRQASP